MTRFEPTGTIEDIVPEARPAFDRLLAQAEAWGMHPSVRGAGRTCAMQEAISSGATRAGMCRSLHVVHRALDIDLSPNTCATYTRLGMFWESLGGTWGGRWTHIWPDCGDRGHFHYMPGHQATPTSLCPRGVSLSECEDVRERYLAEQFGSSGSRGRLLGFGVAAVGLTVAVALYMRKS